MVYIYDILLNFNKNGRIYDFFEWELNDNIVHIKKIPLFKVDSVTLMDIDKSNFKVSKEFMLKIKSLTEIYVNKKIERIMYAALFTDTKRAIAVGFNYLGQSLFKSNMLLDEEDEVIDVSDKLDVMDLKYSIEKVTMRDYFTTRNDEEVKEFLKNEINRAFKSKDANKLKYMYVEYFDDNKEDVNAIYRDLLRSLELGINEKHSTIYNLLKMACSKK